MATTTIDLPRLVPLIDGVFRDPAAPTFETRDPAATRRQNSETARYEPRRRLASSGVAVARYGGRGDSG